MEDVPQPEQIIQYPDISAEIKRMYEVDQDMREKSLKDPEMWDFEVDKTNTERMKQIVSDIRWPTTSKVGEEGSHNAWLLVQHADHDRDFQKKCLELMKQESSEEVLPKNIAFLTDRILVHEGKSQLYGTQFAEIDGKDVLEPIEDPDSVDERRKLMGMETLEEGIADFKRRYNIKD